MAKYGTSPAGQLLPVKHSFALPTRTLPSQTASTTVLPTSKAQGLGLPAFPRTWKPSCVSQRSSPSGPQRARSGSCGAASAPSGRRQRAQSGRKEGFTGGEAADRERWQPRGGPCNPNGSQVYPAGLHFGGRQLPCKPVQLRLTPRSALLTL